MKYNIAMKKARILLILGIWVAILPYLGFPYTLKNILLTLSGLGLIFLSYTLYLEYKATHVKKEKNFDNFRENADFSEVEVDGLN